MPRGGPVSIAPPPGEVVVVARTLALRQSRTRWLAPALAVAMVGMLAATVKPAAPFAPYTHNATGTDAWTDATDGDGGVFIAGHEYPVNPTVAAALADHKSYYDAGVVGPDAFPDIVMGQSVIHPEDTGLWLRLLLQKAWAAQSDPGYSDEQKAEILAWSYGFLTHAAGDVWSHTLINKFAQGVFPDVGLNLLTNPADLSNSLRHVLTELYIADATPGYDGSVDVRKQLPDGDVSDKSTPASAYDAPPDRFIYETFVARDNGVTSNDRGKLLDFFYWLRDQLQSVVNGIPDPLEPIQTALDEYSKATSDLAAISSDCPFAHPVDCVADLISLGYDATLGTIAAIFDTISGEVQAALGSIVKDYLTAWIDDIDSGLQAWGELGLAIAKGAFDAQTRRDIQNDECGYLGADSLDPDSLRGACEDKIGLIDTILEATKDFQNEHLLGMLGFPDFVGSVRDELDSLSDEIKNFIGPFAVPILEPINDIKNDITDRLKDEVNQRFGIDVDGIKEFLKSPSTKMDLTSVSLTVEVGGTSTTVSLPLFQPGDHALLDSLLGLPADHHESDGRLKDSAVFDPAVFAAYKNVVTTGKLLLLDGPTMNQLLSDLTGHPTVIYGSAPDDNVMTTPLPGVADVTDPATASGEWIRLIDGDHAWRKDGQPVFTDPNRFGGPSGGNGNFPLWESCALRTPVFRTLFTDWENATNFPPIGDDPSPDPNDPNPPTSSLAITGPSYDNGTTTYLGAGATLTMTGHDDYFSDNEVAVDVTAPDPATGSNPAVVVPSAGDGPYALSFHAHDPCRTETPNTPSLTIDRSAPSVACGAPDGLWHAADQTLGCTASDSGSGLADAAHDAAFTLSTSVPAGTETANAQTGTRTVCDRVSNCVTVGPIGGNRVDKKPPVITITTPGSGATYTLNATVNALYACVDGGSGLASCGGTVASGSPISTSPVGVKSFTVNAADSVANASTKTVLYNVSYGICLLYDPTKALGSAGSTVPVKVRVCDAAKTNLSSPSLVLTATALDGSPPPPDFSGTSNLGNLFRYDPTLAGYVYNVSTKGLGSGTHTMTFTVSGGDPVAHAAQFKLK